MYIVLTTMPKQGSGNVGDLLIEQSLKELVTRETGEREFVTFFREEPLAPHLDLIARAEAVLMPGFAIRDLPMTPGCYQLVDDWSRIPGAESSGLCSATTRKPAATPCSPSCWRTARGGLPQPRRNRRRVRVNGPRRADRSVTATAASATCAAVALR